MGRQKMQQRSDPRGRRLESAVNLRKVRQRTLLQKKLHYERLKAHYCQVGERLGDSLSSEVKGAIKEASAGGKKYVLDVKAVTDEQQTDLLDLKATKEAILALGAELGIADDMFAEAQAEEQLAIIKTTLDGQHRTGRRKR